MSQTSPATPQTSIRARWLVLTVVLVGALMAIIDVAIVNVAIPSIRHDMHSSVGLVELVVSGYTVTYASFLVTGGRLGDMFGRRRLFAVGLAVFIAASAICGLAPSIWVLIIARAVQGVGGAMLYPQVLAFIQVAFPAAERARALGIFGAVVGIGAIAGQLLGGLLLSGDLFGMGWRTIFLVNLPLGIAALCATFAVLPADRDGTRSHLDWGGVGLVTTALAALVVPLLTGREAGWPLWTVLCLVAVLPLGIAFLRHERAVTARGGTPLVRMDLFANKGFSVGVPIAALFAASYGGFLMLLAIYLQIGLGFTPLAAALTYAPNAAGFFIASLVASRATRMLGRHTMTLGYLLAAAGLLVTAGTVAAAGASVAGWQLAPALLLAGFGQGLGMTPLIGAVIGTLTPADAGAGAGVLTTTLQVGNATGVALLSLLFFAVLGTSSVPARYATAYAAALPFIAGLLVAAALLVTRLPAAGGRAGNALLEHLPGRATGLAYSVFLLTGGRLGDSFFAGLLGHAIDRRAERVRDAPIGAGEFLAYQFEADREDRAWLRYLMREALRYEDVAVPHESERRQVIAAQVNEVRERQQAGALGTDVPPELARLMAFALGSFPYLLPQITRMTTGYSPEDPAFVSAWTAFLRQLGDRLAPADRPTWTERAQPAAERYR